MTIARDWNAQGVPGAYGGPWGAPTLRRALLSSRIAGAARARGRPERQDARRPESGRGGAPGLEVSDGMFAVQGWHDLEEGVHTCAGTTVSYGINRAVWPLGQPVSRSRRSEGSWLRRGPEMLRAPIITRTPGPGPGADMVIRIDVAETMAFSPNCDREDGQRPHRRRITRGRRPVPRQGDRDTEQCLRPRPHWLGAARRCLSCSSSPGLRHAKA